ncbi:hypothetical protein JTE90_028398 [Oedothorax gibbosus]|uniref:VWFC domain-containing protein n=1 Tax=Oedothorax gibbosus TaxID=931172 RepID=A0AAV6VFI1_9ARAC|nr:hypothetical protein JTE90_028398 [Oedothorax gibbosus]
MDFSISNLFLLCLVLCYPPVHTTKEGVDMGEYQHCLDHKGKEVVHGERFFPLGSDPCTQCTCLNGKPQMCIAVFCSPPENCRQYHALSDKCCEFVCLDRDFPNKAQGNGTYTDSDALSTTNLGLRLVASTVTSFLILALLLFMIHRLRQRRLLLMIRRFHARRMDNGTAHLSRRFSEDEDGGSVGYFAGGHDQLDFSRYDEPPPPYTLWKPPEMYIPPGEAPPPYDLSVQLTAPFSYASPSHQSAATQQQAVVSVRAETHEAPAAVAAAQSSQPTAGTAHQRLPNCSICEAVDYELSLMANSTAGHLPPDTQYEDSYVASTSAAGASSVGVQIEGVTVETRDEAEVAGNATISIDNGISAVMDNAATSSANDNAIPSTSSCTCAATIPRRGKSKRHSCCDTTRAGLSRSTRTDTLFLGKELPAIPAFASTSQDNNNLYPDPTAWCGDACESSSSSSPTYDQPTLSPSTSDSSSADIADFPRMDHSSLGVVYSGGSGVVPFRTIPGRSGRRGEMNFEGGSRHHRDSPEEGSKAAPHFQKTLSNLKKFSLIKRKKKKRRVVERPPEIGCSFVLAPDSIPGGAAGGGFDDGIDLTARNSTENMARPLEAINPHIGHKLASSGYRIRGARPHTIGVHRQRRGYDVHCCGSVVTVSGGTDCAACRNGSSPESVGSHGRAGISRSGSGISRSGSICSETGERRHHRSAGSSPTTTRPNLDAGRFSSDPRRFSGSRYASSSYILGNNNGRGNLRDGDHHIPVWVVNSTARSDYMRRSASGGSMGEASRSVGDVSSPLDFRDSMLSSGSSWEACSHL